MLCRVFLIVLESIRFPHIRARTRQLHDTPTNYALLLFETACAINTVGDIDRQGTSLKGTGKRSH